MDNRLILIAGSGRSGTSLLAGILKAMGAHVPQPEVGADETNPHGFAESQWVVDFHNKLLKATRVHPSDARPAAWSTTGETARDPDVQGELEAWLRREFGHGDHVVVKDPRLLWFTSLWRRVGETVAAPCFITTLRHPLEVIKSKQAYYGDKERWHPNNRVAGWLNTMLYTERATRGSRRSLVRYDDLLSDHMEALARVSDALDLALVERATPAQMRAAARLVDPSLRRARATWASLGVDDRLVELAEETWATFDRAATKDALDYPSLRSDLDRLREQYNDLYAFAESVAESSLGAVRGRTGRGGEGSSGAPTTPIRALRRLRRRVRRKGREIIYRRRAAAQTRGDGEIVTEDTSRAAVPPG